ncbi:hypothetical protein BT96DRAFT_1024372 [Gymnopus androsaceus JB14]|uniref:Mug135-like C-terminal domain-containing protein n=1 Tax=Gymnopus androsaceus JB14 TaxID=1447944 RepID=A0A6A4GYG6_9AGAR|nr:hypothetical protein BT96DRAFT_1024372 [Gymnopus androsaceus JB14]
MALAVPANNSNVIPPPPQNPPTIDDVGRARRYEANMTLLQLQRGTLANAPTDAECGLVAQYSLAVAAKNVPASELQCMCYISHISCVDAAPAWFHGALQAALDPILQEVQGLRGDVQMLRGEVGVMRRDLVILDNRSKGDGLRVPFAAVRNGAGNLPDPNLGLPALTNITVLNTLTQGQAAGWYQHYFPGGPANQSKAAMVNQIARYIGYSAAL